MKRIKIMMIALMMTIVTSASAMTYDQAKQQALFLADKMAYELNLTEEQYEAAYEINLDYLMAVNDYSDVYGTYWSRRNLELQSILTSWQYNAYIAADYFYRPVYWSYNTWNWRIYSYYPTTTWYNARPTVYVSYRGGNNRNYYTSRSWRQPTQRVVRTYSQPTRTYSQPARTVNRTTTTTGNHTFGNLNNSNFNRSNNVNVTNINVNNLTVNRAPSSSNRSFSTSGSSSNRTFGTTSNSRSFGSAKTRSTTSTTRTSGPFGGHR